MANKIKVFISSPYTIGDVGLNLCKAMQVYIQLIDAGYTVYMPLLNHFLHISYPREPEVWMEHDSDWLPACDCVLRLKGPSVGADREVNQAVELNMPVFDSVEELVAMIPPDIDKEE